MTLDLSVLSLNPGELTEMAHAIIFKLRRWSDPYDMDIEVNALRSVSELCFALSNHSLLSPNAQKAAVDKYGARNVARRLISLVTKEKYQQGGLDVFYTSLLQVFCGFEDVRRSIIALRGHAEILRKGWAKIRARPNPKKVEIDDFGPRT